VDVARSKAAEAELDRFIEKRSTRQKDPDEESELWQASVDAYNEKRQKDPDEENERWRESARAYEEKRRQMARAEWHLYHTAQAERMRRTLEELASRHEQEAAKLIDVQPKGAA
jgi:hypothetical protein